MRRITGVLAPVVTGACRIVPVLVNEQLAFIVTLPDVILKVTN